MLLKQPLLKLPIRFCAETLAAEVRALPPEAWEPHPSRFVGNEAVPLVTPAGQITNDFAGPMKPTPYLLRCPYMMEAMAEIGAVWGRGRLMGLGSGATVPAHVDSNYYWRTHVRVHVPIVTNPAVAFTCGDETVHMAAGECWVFDTFREHHVENEGADQRVHLVLDTVGGEHLWELIDAAERGEAADRLLEPGQESGAELLFEQFNYVEVMSPWELQCHVEELIGLAQPAPQLESVRKRLDRFMAGWGAAWARFGTTGEGRATYAELVARVRDDLENIGADGIMLRNQRTLLKVLGVFVFDNMIASRRVQNSVARAEMAEQRLAS